LAELKRKEAIYEETKKKQAETDISLPVDFSQNISHKGLAWLGSAGLTINLLNTYNIGYSKALNRVIIPVYHNGYRGYIARALENWQKPKYLEKTQDKYPFYIHNNYDCLCVVEDTLSCIRVGKYCSCISLNGTAVSKQAMKIIQLYKKVIIWLDPDAAGKKGIIKIRSKIFKPITIIQSEKDPKKHTDDYIKQRIHYERL